MTVWRKTLPRFGFGKCRHPRGREIASNLVAHRSRFLIQGALFLRANGLSQEQIDWVKDLKGVRRGRISEAADEFNDITFHEGQRPWGVEADCAMPSATQNEINAAEGATLLKNGVKAVAEAANMPCEQGAVDAFQDAGVCSVQPKRLMLAASAYRAWR